MVPSNISPSRDDAPNSDAVPTVVYPDLARDSRPGLPTGTGDGAAPRPRANSGRESPESVLTRREAHANEPVVVVTSKFVTKRDGRRVPFKFDKIVSRIARQSHGLHVDPEMLALEVVRHDIGEARGVRTTDIDRATHIRAHGYKNVHPDYDKLAARLVLTDLYKRTKASFSETFAEMATWRAPRSRGRSSKTIVNPLAARVIAEHAAALDEAIDHSMDDALTYMGIVSMIYGPLVRLGGTYCERPQHMFMREAVQCNLPKKPGQPFDVQRAVQSYRYFSTHHVTHATPTVSSACMRTSQLLSCFLQNVKGDSIDGLFETLKESAMISSGGGGMSIAVSNVRAAGSHIAGTNGRSSGVEPFARTLREAICKWVDQGGGKRKGAVALYMEPWHADIQTLLRMNLPSRDSTAPREVKTAVWVPDLFMRKVEEDGDWYLFSPDEAPGLYKAHGAKFDALYERYVREGRYRRKVRAREIYEDINRSRIETGVPYFLFKDAANRLSNHKHLGTIRCSNLCIEIIEFTSASETACCTLASFGLPSFVTPAKTKRGQVLEPGSFDYQRLYEVVRHTTRNLDNVIDLTHYPTRSARRSNLRNRPMAMGVSGAGDLASLLRVPFDTPEGTDIRRQIFETIYFAALSESVELARVHGPYPTYAGSPASQGLLHFDLWSDPAVNPAPLRPPVKFSGRWNWAELREKIKMYGLRNSLFVGPMPTASTAHMLGFSESFYPHTGVLYRRKTIAGTFMQVNSLMVQDLIECGLWDKKLREAIVRGGGSVQQFEHIPKVIRDNYRTVWDIKQSFLVRDAAEWAPFVDQNMSRSAYFKTVDEDALTSLDFLCWNLGLKSSTYYLYTGQTVLTNFSGDSAGDGAYAPTDEEVSMAVDGSISKTVLSSEASALSPRRDDAESPRDSAPPGAAMARSVSDLGSEVQLVLSEDALVCSLANGADCAACQG